jgi:hypothetical protein
MEHVRNEGAAVVHDPQVIEGCLSFIEDLGRDREPNKAGRTIELDGTLPVPAARIKGGNGMYLIKEEKNDRQQDSHSCCSLSGSWRRMALQR